MKHKNHLKEIRNKQELSLQELEDISGVTKQQCWTLEKGESLPKISTAYAIAKVLGLSVYDIWPDNTKITEEKIIIRRVVKDKPE